jgi:enediyne biosynthesis protein E4
MNAMLQGLLLPLLLLQAPAPAESPAPVAVAESHRRTERARLRTLRTEAESLLKQAKTHEAAVRLEALAARASAFTPPLLPQALRDELGRVAAALRAPGASSEPARQLLARVATRLEEPPLGLTFQGSYTEAKVAEPAVGGHATAMGPPPTPTRALQKPPATPSAIRFEERPVLGVKTFGGGATRNHILESGGTGLAIFDYDQDGRPDIYLVNADELDAQRQRIPHRNALFRNLGGWRFEDVSARAGVDAATWGSGACAGDADGDGRLDLYVTNYGANLLYRNKGDGTFEEVAAKAGVRATGWSTGCTFLDADADGDLDLYVARYVSTTWDDLQKAERTLVWRGGPKTMVGPVGLPGEADLFYENRGQGTFVEATDAHGLSDSGRAYGFGVVATDYDDDGWPDLFVANDTTPNFLYRNRGQGRFEAVGLLAGVALNGAGRTQAGMGADAGDFDNDGRMDLVLTTFAHDAKTLFRNLGQGLFEDVSQATGLAAQTFQPMGWGTAFMDADLDGRLDLFIANGHIYPDVDAFPALQETFRQTNQILRNEGDTFRDVSDTAGAGLKVKKASRGLATGDLDGDGDLDLVITALDEIPTVLENRQEAGNHWLAVRLQKPAGNRFCIGARVTVTSGERRQVREVRSGGSYVSHNDLPVQFGLGAAASPVDVEVRLPGGTRWRFTGLAVDRLHVLTLEEGQQVRH